MNSFVHKSDRRDIDHPTPEQLTTHLARTIAHAANAIETWRHTSDGHVYIAALTT